MTVSVVKRPALVLSLSVSVLAGCAKEEPDAYGNFEATEVRVSAEVSGRLLQFDVEEGALVAGGTAVGQVDTTDLALQRHELVSRLGAARSRTTERRAQVQALRAQLETAQDEHGRIRRLYSAQAATAQQLDRAEGEVRVLSERIDAALAQTTGARDEATSVELRIDQLTERIRKSRIVNPLTGTVLTTYTEAGEFVQPGQPLYTIANLDTLILRAYVSGAQLAELRIGEPVHVQIDVAVDELMALQGRITWIASQAEFTPTPIQTRDERTEQVYAVKIRVANRDGVIKIGMPGEVVFAAAGDGASLPVVEP